MFLKDPSGQVGQPFGRLKIREGGWPSHSDALRFRCARVRNANLGPQGKNPTLGQTVPDARTKFRLTLSVATILLLFVSTFYVFFYYCFGSQPVDRWPHLAERTSRLVKEIFQGGALFSALYAYTKIVFKPEEVAKALRNLARMALDETLLVQKAFAKLALWLRPGFTIPDRRYYAPGMRWWEDGPLYVFFAWLVEGPPGLGRRVEHAYTQLASSALPPQVPYPGALIAVKIPIFFTKLVFFSLAAYWLICVVYLLSLVVAGSWRAPRSRMPYGTWLRERVRTFNDWASGFPPDAFKYASQIVRRPEKQSESVRFFVLLTLFLCFLWPAIVYLYALSLALWLLALTFFALAFTSSAALKFGPRPRYVVLGTLTSFLLGCWLAP